MMPPAFVWLNGRVLPFAEARISPLDHGLTVGDGVFETLPDRGHGPVALTRHWQRLEKGCEALGLQAPSIDLMRTALREVMRANGLRTARLRFTVTSGEGPPGSNQGNAPPTLLAVATPIPEWPEASPVQSVPWTRNGRGALCGIKSISYAENVIALAYAKKHGAQEAVFADTRGLLCEGSGSNIFVLQKGEVLTPTLDGGCLPGVTRGLVLEACRRSGIPVREGHLPLAEFEGLIEEAFLTSSTRDVHPISAINGRLLARTKGEVLHAVSEAYQQLLADNVDP